MGDPSGYRGRERNSLWRHFTGSPSRVVKTAEEMREFEESMVADLRASAATYPSPRFAEVWEQRGVTQHTESTKVIDHPDVRTIAVDCDVLSARGSDLRIIACTVEPGSESVERLELVRVIGLQSMSTSFAEVS